MAKVSASNEPVPRTVFAEEKVKLDNNNSNGDAVSSDSVQLKKELGLLDGVAIIVGVIVGSGIFISPKGVLDNSGSTGQALIVWVLSGVLSMVGALCYAELGTMIPKSGGDYAYIGASFGPLPAFLYLWVALLILVPTGNAITALAFAQYLLQPYWPMCDPPYWAVRLIAAFITCLLTGINCYNVKWVTRITDTFTATKVFALLIIVAAGAWYLISGHFEHWSDPFEGSKTTPGYIALAFYSGLFSYSGWNYLNFVTEELRNPYENLPRAICISMPVITTIYVVTNIAYFSVLSIDQILASDAVAVTFGEKMLGWFAWTMPLFVAASTFGSLNGAIFASSRLFFVGARNGHLPAAIALININYVTPIPSLLFMCIITVALLFIKNVYSLINYVSYVEALFILLSVAGLLILRKKQPDLTRPIKVNAALPVIYLITASFLVISSIYQSPWETGIGTLVILLGIPVYYATIHHPQKWLTETSQRINLICQKLFLCVPNQEKID